MSDNKSEDAWNRRKVLDYSKIHGNDINQFKALIGALSLKDGMKIADIMCGYGAVSKEILKACVEKGINVDLFLVDAFQSQIELAVKNLSSYSDKKLQINFNVEDARHMSFPNLSLDAIIIKNGIHEVRMPEQLSILREAYRSLKQNGNLFVWMPHGQEEDENRHFAEIVRKKDELAGFSSFLKNRYFSSKREIELALESVGFASPELVHSSRELVYNTLEFCKTDFAGDIEKLREYNNYIDQSTPDYLKKSMNYTKQGDEVKFSVMKTILRAKKPWVF